MNRFKGPYKRIDLLAPDETRFDLEYKGEIFIEDIGYTIKPRSLYHFFIVQIVAELQKDYRKGFKNGVPPQIVLQYLKHQNDKFGLLKRKQINKIDALKAAWRNHLRKGEKERIHFYKKDKRIKLSDNDRVVFLQDLFLLLTTDKRKEGLFKINIDERLHLNIVSPLFKGFPPQQANILKDQQTKIGVTKDSFTQSHEALIGSYCLLSPGEAVLQDPPMIPGFDTPKFFRKTGPVAADIKGGKIHIRDEVLEIIKALEEHKVVLLSGYAASGKTVLARLIAYDWFKDGKKVRFVQFKTDFVELFTLKHETVLFGEEKPDPLLVIEDVHLAWDLINEFLSWRTQVWPKVLITTRKPLPELPSVVIDYFYPIFKIEIQPPDLEIVKSFFKIKGWKPPGMLKREVLNVSKGNLWLLSYALKTLNMTGGKEIHHDSIIEEVRRDLKDLSKIRRDLSDASKFLMPRLLIALSVLYRYEIPTELQFIYQRFPYSKAQIKAALDVLVKMGEVLLIHQRGNILYGLPHSTLAKLYFQFTMEPIWEESAVYGDTDDLLCEFLVSKNACNIMNPSHFFTHISRMIPWNNISEKLNKEKLGRRISKSGNFFYATSYIKNINNFDPEAAEELAKNIDMAKFAKIIIETPFLWLAGAFIMSLYEASPCVGEELWRCLDKDGLTRAILEATDLFCACGFMQTLFEADREVGKELWGYMDKGKLAGRISETTDLLAASRCINSLFEADREVGRELWGYVNKGKLASRISETTDIRLASSFIYYLFEADHEVGRELWGYVNKGKLASRISETTDSWLASAFIYFLFEADREVGRELWGYIDKGKLASRISETTEAWAAGDCMYMIFNAEFEVGKQLWGYIDKAKLANAISETTNVWNVVQCISKLFQADSTACKELWEFIGKDNIDTRICEILPKTLQDKLI